VLVVDVCGPMCVLDMLIDCQARFPFKRSRLRCVNETRKKRKRLRLNGNWASVQCDVFVALYRAEHDIRRESVSVQ